MSNCSLFFTCLSVMSNCSLSTSAFRSWFRFMYRSHSSWCSDSARSLCSFNLKSHRNQIQDHTQTLYRNLTTAKNLRLKIFVVFWRLRRSLSTRIWTGTLVVPLSLSLSPLYLPLFLAYGLLQCGDGWGGVLHVGLWGSQLCDGGILLLNVLLQSLNLKTYTSTDIKSEFCYLTL